MAVPLSPGGGALPKAAPVANLKTAANPRGVAISLPKAAPATLRNARAVAIPRALSTGANPRGISLGLAPRTPTIADVKAQYEHLNALAKALPHQRAANATGGLEAFRAGAIKPPGFVRGGAGILGNFFSDLYHLPQSTISGVLHLGVPAVEGIGNALSGHEGQALHDFGTVGKTAWAGVKADPFVQAIEQGSLKPLGEHPLNAGLDLLGGYGVVGKGIGMAGRAGLLGEDVKAATALGGRAPRVVLPGAEGTDVPRGYSPNAITQLGQKKFDTLEAKGKLPQIVLKARDARERRLQVASMHAAETGQLRNEENLIDRVMRTAKPDNTPEQTAAHIIAHTGGGKEVLYRVYDNLLKEPAAGADHATLASRARALKALGDAVAADREGKLNWANAFGGAARMKPLSELQEIQKETLGQRTAAEMQKHLDAQRTLIEPDVHYLEKPVADPRLVSIFKGVKEDLAQKQAELADAKAAQAGSAEAHRRLLSYNGDITRRLPVNYVNDQALNRLIDEGNILKESKAEMAQAHAARVAEAEKAVADATKARDVVRMAIQRHKMSGPVIEDQSVPEVVSKRSPVHGMRVRPLTPDDVGAIHQGFRISQDTGIAHRVSLPDPAVDLQSYVSSTNPERRGVIPSVKALRTKGSDIIAPAAERGNKGYTGEALRVGDQRIGWNALTRTLLENARQLSEERETQAFLKRFAVPNKDRYGIDRGWANDTAARNAAHEYEQTHGIDMTTINHRGQLYNVPKDAVRELNRQRELDRPTTLGKFLTAPNRWFRNTVLPYSPKLPIMHNIENPSRIVALEKGNIPRILTDWRGARKVFDAMGPAEKERLHTLLTPGSMTHSITDGEAEDLGRLPGDMGPAETFLRSHGFMPTERGLPTHVIQGVAKTNERLAQFIIGKQRILERQAQTVAMGAHMRQVLQEWGVSWKEAQNSWDTYAQKLADHLATPADAERAARAMHTALGKYNAFTANSRIALRVMPFGSWYLNAAKLVFQVLPRDHPLFDALLQDVAVATDAQWKAQHAGVPPDLQDAWPDGPNSWQDFAKLTPVGLPNQTPVGTALQLMLPEYMGTALAGVGKDPFFQDLYGPGTQFGQGSSPKGLLSVTGAQRMQSISSMIDQWLGATAGPVADLARAIYGHGGTLYNESTPSLHLLSGGLLGKVEIKPGTTSQKRGPIPLLNQSAALDKTFDPFHPTHYVPQVTSTAGTLGRGPQVVGKLGGAIGRAPTVEGK